VTALGEELRPILARASSVRWVRAGGRRVARGRLRGREVVVVATGVGPRRAEEAALALLAAVRAARLVGAGVAGGLSPGLGPGDLILAQRIVRDLDGIAVPPSPDALRAAGLGGGVRDGTIVTLERLLPTRDAKAEVLERLALPAPAVADMESAGWARAATSLGLPYTIVRAVLDPAEEDLPGFLAACVGPDGSVARSRVIAHALVHPADLRVLLTLRRRVRACAEALARVVERLVEIDA
jgi:adenosylhomocysteine nucleosidase